MQPKVHRTSSDSSSRSELPGVEDELRNNHLKLKGEDVVAWDPDTKEHPRNWSSLHKTTTVLLIYWLEFFMTAISSSGAATAKEGLKEYGISQTLAYFAFISVYLIGQTVGGIFCSPVSEVFGRRTIYGIGTSLFCASSAVVAAPRSLVAVFVGRFFQGFAASIPANVAFGNFTDLFDAHGRIWIVYGYTVSGIAGLSLGPIYSSYVTAHLGWRWVYYIATIAAGASLIPCIFMKESNADQLLQAKVGAVKKAINKESLVAEGSERHKLSVSDFIQSALYRPLKMLVTEPLVFFCAALCGVAFGLIYGLTESLNIVYTAEPFSFSSTTASLSFIALLIGEVLDILPRFYDDHLLKKSRRLNRRILPETKIRSFAIACPSLAIGLWIFGWTIPPKVTTVPWPVSMIGLVCVGFSVNDFSYVLFGYVSDAYGPHAASAASALNTTRNLMAAVFPLFITQMYKGLGSNVATSVLAAVATAFCFTPWLFLTYGSRLRQKSRMAPNDEDCLEEENRHLEGGTELE